MYKNTFFFSFFNFLLFIFDDGVFCLLIVSSGINYDKPLPPIQVASLRAERIAKEKKVWSSARPDVRLH